MQIIANKYKIISELGEGGTGVVYLARHIDLEIDFAIKVLDKRLSADIGFIERFKQEAALLQRFTHPSITQLRDFGKTDEGDYYLAMDYCPGKELKDVLLEDGPYPVRSALKLIIQILDVLEAAHSYGIIHRDIKPENIMIEISDNVEVVKVLDFGTAILKERLEESFSNEEECLGTPAYMAPEQAAGEGSLDHRVDIYATGIVLYEMLTGKVPFDGQSVVETLLMQITYPPISFSSQYGIPQYIEDIVFKALEKNPQDRFQSASEFKDACLEALKRGRINPFSAFNSFNKDSTANFNIDIKIGNEIKRARDKKKDTKILCLDDDDMILNILQHILTAEGYQVYVVNNFSALHSYLFEQGVDLVLSDVNMPGLRGTKICKLLKKTAPELKVLLFSNNDESLLSEQAKECNADGYISKYWKPIKWLEEINSVIKG